MKLHKVSDAVRGKIKAIASSRTCAYETVVKMGPGDCLHPLNLIHLHAGLTGSIDSTIRCWDCRSRKPEPIQTLDEARDGISSVKVSDHEVLAG